MRLQEIPDVLSLVASRSYSLSLSLCLSLSLSLALSLSLTHSLAHSLKKQYDPHLGAFKEALLRDAPTPLSTLTTLAPLPVSWDLYDKYVHKYLDWGYK